MNISTANVIAFVLNVLVVYGSQWHLFGKDNAQVSADHPTLITPAGWAFSIWGIIFTLELIFVIWQAVTPAGSSDIVVKGVGPWFAVACVIQAVWTIAFSQELLTLSAILLTGIAVALCLTVAGLAEYKSDTLTLLQTSEGWLVHFPMGLHAGWTCAAALVNISVALESYPLSTRVAALILSVSGACIAASFAAVVYADQVFVCAIAWALAGIASKTDVRQDLLTADVAQGVDEALRASWVGLLALSAVIFLGSGTK